MSKLKPNQFRILSDAIITERPMLFSTEMVQATLQDRKTETRRKIKGQPTGEDAVNLKDLFDQNPEYFYETCNYGKPGDLLWVREAWGYTALDIEGYPGGILYRSDYSEPKKAAMGLASNHWKPSIHMPKAASRIWLMIKEIRVEKLKDITPESAIAEGIEEISEKLSYSFELFKDYLGEMPDGYQTPEFSFYSLWKSINGEASCKENPWVWVIKLRVLSKTGRPSKELISEAYSEVVNHSHLRGRKEASHV